MSKLRQKIDLVEYDLKLYGVTLADHGQSLLKEIEHAISEALDALEQAEEYFEKLADADMDQDGYIPNEEMRHLVRIQNVIKLL